MISREEFIKETENALLELKQRRISPVEFFDRCSDSISDLSTDDFHDVPQNRR